MKHFSTALASLAGLALTACSASESAQGQSQQSVVTYQESLVAQRQEQVNSRAIAVCLDGVQYWFHPRYKKTVLAPRYSAETREVKLCPSGVVPVEDQPYIANQ